MRVRQALEEAFFWVEADADHHICRATVAITHPAHVPIGTVNGALPTAVVFSPAKLAQVHVAPAGELIGDIRSA